MDTKLVNKIKEGLIKNLSFARLFRQSQSFVERAFNSMNDAISIIDVKTFKILYANKKFIETYGTNSKDIIGRNCYEITHRRNTPCAAPNDACPMCDVVKSKKYSMMEHLHLDKNGNRHFVEVSASPIAYENGRVTAVIHVSRDITERKQMMDRLIESYKHLGIINRKLSLLLDLDRQTQGINKKEITQYITSVAVSISHAFFVGLYQLDSNGNFRLLSAAGLSEKEEKELKIISPVNGGALKNLTAENKKHWGTTDSYDIGALNIGKKIHSFLILPLIQKRNDGSSDCILFFGFMDKKPIPSQELDFYEVFANQVSFSLLKAGFL